MTIIIAIIIFIGTLFLIYQLYKSLKEKNERDEELITIYDFASVQFVDNGFTVGKDAEANAIRYLDSISKDGLSYHNHEEEDWLQPHEYDEYEELFETEEESANRIYNEMLDDISLSDEDIDDFLPDFADESNNLPDDEDTEDFLLEFEEESDYFDEEEFLSQFYDVEIEESSNDSIENVTST